MKKDIDQMQIIGKLPFPLLIEDSIDEDGKFLDDKFIQINDDENTIATGLYFRKVINKNQEGFIIAIEDYYGEFSYTQFCLIFRKKHTINNDLNFFYTNNGQIDIEKILDYTTKLINRFLTFYKVVNEGSKDWIPLIESDRLSPFRIILIGNDNKEFYNSLFDNRGNGLGLGSNLKEDKLEKLRYYCKSDVKLTLLGFYLQQANRYYFTGDYVSYILFLAFYIETTIFEIVKKELLKKGLNNDEIESKLKKEGKFVHKYEALELVLGKKGIKEFKKTNEHKKYDEMVKMRDSIAHGREVSLNRNIIEEIRKDCNIFIEYLQKLFK